jgi:hypothetical protein
MRKETKYKMISAAAGCLVMFIFLSVLFRGVDKLRDRSIMKVHIPIEIKEPTKPKKIAKAPVKKKPAKKKPLKKPAQKGASAKPVGQAYANREKMPVINIYYGFDIHEYMRALAQRGCLLLFKSPTGKLFARYDPISGRISKVYRDLRGYSPRTRILAVYGENPLGDRVIEKAVLQDPMLSFPDGVKLIALLSLEWENKLLGAIQSVAEKNGVDPDKVESAEARFEAGKFYLERIYLSDGGTIKVNFLAS